MTAIAVLGGAMFAAGLLLFLSGLNPATPSLADAVAQLHTRTAPRKRFQLGIRPSQWITIDGQSRLGRDLTIVGIEPDAHAAKTVAAACAGIASGPAIAMLCVLLGASISFIVPIWVALLAGLIGAIVPTLGVKRAALQRRREFRHALGAYLDLLAMLLAANEGTEGALHHAAEAGQGWAFDELRRALRDARTRGAPMWDALSDLAERLEITELAEISAAANLGGSQGASVRRTLIAKARSLRAHALSTDETDARNRSKQMALPLMAIAVAFLIFLFYPALAQLSAS